MVSHQTFSPECPTKINPTILPGEDITVNENATNEEIPEQQNTTQDTLSAIDNIFNESCNEKQPLDDNNNASEIVQMGLAHNDEQGTIQTKHRPGTFYNTTEQQFSNYTALSHLLDTPDDMSYTNYINISDASVELNGHEDESASEPPPEISYYNFGGHQYAEDSAPLGAHDNTGANTQEYGNTVERAGTCDDIVYEQNQIQSLSDVPAPYAAVRRAPRSIGLLKSSTSYRACKARRRAEMICLTQLDDIEEVSEYENHSLPSSPSSESDSSGDFAGLRGVVQAVPVRRAFFLD